MVVGGMAWPVGIGLAVGLGAAGLLDDAVERFLYGVTPGDIVTFGAIGLSVPLVALVATLVPAREATRVDPLVALRSE
jgi:ABC-type lipoprotein release transport system permease subunit